MEVGVGESSLVRKDGAVVVVVGGGGGGDGSSLLLAEEEEGLPPAARAGDGGDGPSLLANKEKVEEEEEEEDLTPALAPCAPAAATTRRSEPSDDEDSEVRPAEEEAKRAGEQQQSRRQSASWGLTKPENRTAADRWQSAFTKITAVNAMAKPMTKTNSALDSAAAGFFDGGKASFISARRRSMDKNQIMLAMMKISTETQSNEKMKQQKKLKVMRNQLKKQSSRGAAQRIDIQAHKERKNTKEGSVVAQNRWHSAFAKVKDGQLKPTAVAPEEEERSKEEKEDHLSKGTGHRDDDQDEMTFSTFKLKAYLIMFDPTSSTPALAVERVLAFMIVFSVFTIVLESVVELREGGVYAMPTIVWQTMEAVITIIFTIEFCARAFVWDVLLWDTGTNLWKSSLTWTDFLAILPFYIELVMIAARPQRPLSSDYMCQTFGEGNQETQILGMLRMCRVLRVFKMTAHYKGSAVLYSAMQRTWRSMVAPIFLLANLFVIFGSMMYYLEQGHRTLVDLDYNVMTTTQIDALGGCNNPGWVFTNCEAQGALTCEAKLFENPIMSGASAENCAAAEANSTKWAFMVEEDAGVFLKSMYEDVLNAGYSMVITMTTVGYGDQAPKTVLGKLICGLAMMLGLCIISMPITIVGKAITEGWHHHQTNIRRKQLREEVRGASDDASGRRRRTFLSKEQTDNRSMMNRMKANHTSQGPRKSGDGDQQAGEEKAPHRRHRRGQLSFMIRSTKINQFSRRSMVIKKGQSSLTGNVAMDDLREDLMHTFLLIGASLHEIQNSLTRIESHWMTDPSLACQTLLGELASKLAQARVLHNTLCTVLDRHLAKRCEALHTICWDCMDCEQFDEFETTYRDKHFAALRETVLRKQDSKFALFVVDAYLRPSALGTTFLLFYADPTFPPARRYQYFIMGVSFLAMLIAAMETTVELNVNRLEDMVWVYAEIAFSLVMALDFIVYLMATGRQVREEKFICFLHFVCAAPLICEQAVAAVGRDGTAGAEYWRVVMLSLRFVRGFKLIRLSSFGSEVMRGTFVGCGGALFIPFFFLLLIVSLLAVTMYEVERGNYDCDEQRFYNIDGDVSDFVDITRAIWVMLVTMSTVGFGDYFPVTPLGKTVSMFAAVFGVIYFAMPIAIVGDSFLKSWNNHLKRIGSPSADMFRLAPGQSAEFRRYKSTGSSLLKTADQIITEAAKRHALKGEEAIKEVFRLSQQHVTDVANMHGRLQLGMLQVLQGWRPNTATVVDSATLIQSAWRTNKMIQERLDSAGLSGSHKDARHAVANLLLRAQIRRAGTVENAMESALSTRRKEGRKIGEMEGHHTSALTSAREARRTTLTNVREARRTTLSSVSEAKPNAPPR